MNLILRSGTIIFTLLFNACSTTAQNSENITKNIDATEFKHKIEQNDSIQIIDVRTPAEWKSGIIENASTINWHDSNFKEQVNALNKNLPVLIYCASGGRSSRAMKKLSKLGFGEIYNLSGGIKAWKSADYSLKK